jgi:hypothetical protein
MPSITVPVSRTSATIPVALVEYQSSVDPDVNGALSRCPALISYDPPDETTGGAPVLTGAWRGGDSLWFWCPALV